MEITVTERIDKKYTLTPKQMSDVTRSVLWALVQPANEFKMYGGVQWLTEWTDTGHGSGLWTKIRKASEFDKAVFLLLEEL